MKRMILTAVAVLLMSPCLSFAQKFSVSTNLMDYVCLGTLNVDVSYALSRRWSITGGVKYNPFTFRADNPERQFQYRQISGSLGARIWPWHTLSGWWFAGRLRYQEYNKGGPKRKRETGLVRACIRDIPICSHGTSIWNSDLDYGLECPFTTSIRVRCVV